MYKSKKNISNSSAPLKYVVAIVGCDGTGKSTLSADLYKHFKSKGVVQRRYLGTISGEVGDKIKALPFIGVKLENYLNKKAQRAQDIKKKLPGTGTALIMYFFSWWRALHLLNVRRLSRKGIMVVADRFPQAEISGFHYDGPGLTLDRTNNWLIKRLAVREQKLYEWMAEQKPSLIIRLNIDAETAFSRKPDHSIEELRDKSAVMPKINFNDAQIFDIDARAPYDEVLAAALNAIESYIPKLSSDNK